MSETIKASDLRRGVWLWHSTQPAGWFKVMHVMSLPERADGRTVRVAVNGRHAQYESFHAPDDTVTVRFDPPA